MANETDGASPGAVIDGFTLGARVHPGAMGALYRVTQPGCARPLVMKMPRVGPEAPGESLVAFETEATIVPTLEGPHVPRFVARGDAAGIPYLVTEWVDGLPLEDLFARGRAAPAEVARVGAAVADALHDVHQQGVVHLDLKPENVILRGDGTAVLIDFGFAHHDRHPDLLAEATRFGMGSAPYVSPEQLLGRRGDRRSDIFALGVMLYELATGELPFGEPDSDVRNRFWLDPSPPVALAPQVPRWLQEIILRCLEPRAELRYEAASDVAFDLRHPEQVVLTERAAKLRRAGPVAHVQRFLRARAEHGPLLRAPAALVSPTPMVLVAIDTAHLEDERHSVIRGVVSQLITLSDEFRLICLSVIPPFEAPLEHRARLRSWAAPLGLPSERLSLHALDAASPAEAIIELARYNNVDLVVLGAPSEGGRAWSQSVASSVTARVRCSVHVVRVPQK